MLRNNMSRYLFEDEVLDFLASDDSEEEKLATWIGFLQMIAKKTGKKYLHVIHLLKKKWMTNHASLFLQTKLFSTPKRGKQHLLQIMLVEQLRIISFDEVQDRQDMQNLSAQK